MPSLGDDPGPSSLFSAARLRFGGMACSVGASEGRVVPAVAKVNGEADREPNEEAYPRVWWQADHDEQASGCTEATHEPGCSHPERARDVRVCAAQDRHGGAH